MVVRQQRSVAPALGLPFYAAALFWLLLLGLMAAQIFFTFAVDWHRARAEFRVSGGSTAGLVAILAMSSVGALLAWRQPANRVGWLLLSIALFAIFVDLPRLYAGYGVYVHPGLLPAALWGYWLNQVAWIILFTQLMVLLPLVFPDGRLLSRRWVMVVRLAVIPHLPPLPPPLPPPPPPPLPNPARLTP